MIKVGDGKYQRVEEGQLRSYEPPREPVRGEIQRKRSGRPRLHFKSGASAHVPEMYPGWKLWRGRIRKEEIKRMPKGSYGRPPGVWDGITKIALKEFMKDFLISDEDFREAWDSLAEESAIVRITMQQHLNVIRGDYSIKDKQFSQRELAAYYKNKPIVQREVKIEKTADDWALSLDSIEDLKDEWLTVKN